MWPLSIVFTLLLFAFLSRWTDRRYRYAAGIALVGHILVAVVIVPRVPYTWDIAKFHEAAVLILAGQEPLYGHTVSSFAAFQSLVYAVYGSTPLSLSLVNSLLAVLIPIPLSRLTEALYPDSKTTHVAMVTALFLPLPFFILTVPMRDALSTLAFISMLALFVETVVTESLLPTTVAVPLWGMLYLLRPELALVLVVGASAAEAVYSIDAVSRTPTSLPSLVAVMTPVGVLGFLFFANRFPLAKLNGKLAIRAQGSAAYLESFEYQSWVDVIVAAPVRAIYFQFAPFPLHVEQVFHLAAALSLPVLLLLAIGSVFSLRECHTDRVVGVFLVTVYVAGIVGYGLIDSNFGTTIRHRIPFVFLLVVFASPALNRWWLRLQGTNEPRERDE